MQVVHEADDESRVLASDVEVADGLFSKARGLMFRRSIPADYALVFPFGRPRTQVLHMVFVPFDIDAVWLIDGEVQQVSRLAAWTGLARGRADTIIELPAGAADGVEPGDTVPIEGL